MTRAANQRSRLSQPLPVTDHDEGGFVLIVGAVSPFLALLFLR